MLLAAALGGCAANGAKDLVGLGADANPKPFVPLQKNAAPVDQAVQYWSQAFARNPGDEKAAVAYARNLRAKGEKQKALQVLRRASIANSASKPIASEYARLAIDLGQFDFADKLIARATDPRNPDWRLISAQGAGLAKQGKHKEAQGYFLRALQIKPAHPPLLNNLALAYALNGDISEAEQLLRKASARGQKIGKIKRNLALVLGVQGKFDESQNVAETVYLTEERAKISTDAMKRWVKAPVQEMQPASQGWETVSQVAGDATSTVASAAPQKITPWATETAVAGSTWSAQVAAGN